MSEFDTMHRFIFDQHQVRGSHVTLDASWQTLRMQHTGYPEEVTHVLGEAAAATILLANMVKLREGGSMTIQVTGDGVISLLVIQVQHDLQFRGTIRWNDDNKSLTREQLFDPGSRLVITLEQGNQSQRYQGVVEFNHGDISKALREYFEQSEQLPTRFWIRSNDETVSALMLQKLPTDELEIEPDEDAWPRLCTITDTLKDEELLGLPASSLCHRLYHEETVRFFDAENVQFSCRCNRAKVATMIQSLGKEESESIIEEQQSINVTCEFCNQQYTFDSIDVSAIFTEAPVTPPSDLTQ